MTNEGWWVLGLTMFFGLLSNTIVAVAITAMMLNRFG